MKLSRAIVLQLSLALFLTTVGWQYTMALEVGDKAPDFELNSSKGGKLKLSDLRGKNVLINFYRNDFDPT
jgi:peroxiredoxin Q/BCP